MNLTNLIQTEFFNLALKDVRGKNKFTMFFHSYFAWWYNVIIEVQRANKKGGSPFSLRSEMTSKCTHFFVEDRLRANLYESRIETGSNEEAPNSVTRKVFG